MFLGLVLFFLDKNQTEEKPSLVIGWQRPFVFKLWAANVDRPAGLRAKIQILMVTPKSLRGT